MANTTYTIPLTRFARAVRRDGYQKLADLLVHLDGLDIDIVSINRVNPNLVIVLSDPIPADQIDHLSLR